jgi:hypothetical protein
MRANSIDPRFDGDIMGELLEYSSVETTNPNADIFSTLRMFGACVITLCIGMLFSAWSISMQPISGSPIILPDQSTADLISILLGVVANSGMVGCLFILNESIVHADLRKINTSVILLVISQYSLLFEYLIPSPILHYFIDFIQAGIMAAFFGYGFALFTRNEYLFLSKTAQTCIQVPAFIACILSISQMLAYLSDATGILPYIGVFTLLPAVFGIGMGLAMIIFISSDSIKSRFLSYIRFIQSKLNRSNRSTRSNFNHGGHI